MSLIILISGKQGSGKSSLANNLEQFYKRFNYHVENLALADPIYQIHNTLSAVKNRELLLHIGKSGTDINQNYWVSILINRIISKFAHIYIVSDCRRLYEVENLMTHLPTYQFLTIRLNCNELIRAQRCNCFAFKDHITETELDNFNFHNIIETDYLNEIETMYKAIEFINNRLKWIQSNQH